MITAIIVMNGPLYYVLWRQYRLIKSLHKYSKDMEKYSDEAVSQAKKHANEAVSQAKKHANEAVSQAKKRADEAMSQAHHATQCTRPVKMCGVCQNWLSKYPISDAGDWTLRDA